MALIKCPECGRDISDQAPQCPGCGYAPRLPSLPPPLPAKAAGQGLAVGCIVAIAVGAVLAVIGLLTAIAIPAFLQYRKDARRSLCIGNMRLLDHAKEVLAIQNAWTTGQAIAENDAAIWQQLDRYIDGTNLVCCPEAPGKHYVYGPIDESPRCPVEATFTEHLYNPR